MSTKNSIFNPKDFLVPEKILHEKIFDIKKNLENIFWPQNFFEPQIFLNHQIIWPKIAKLSSNSNSNFSWELSYH